MKKKIILILLLIGFILGSISISSGGDAPGFSVYSGTGSHDSGDFVPASDSEEIIVYKPEKLPEENTPENQDSGKPTITQDNGTISVEGTTIGINDNKSGIKMNRRAYKRENRKIRKSAIQLMP